ncbi:hypothetical protein ENSA5_70050 [Enhygromyxa salina]|uniref:Uncharacterized protein n=1 Tax=Enhygromyxa salina TaxID=215803 RepID=A0A2S9XAL9_9BACT|nr:hypothetical protein [Enhygromyxa salina]PRP89898.1 hypothetical protein ENSA5_70050 [Enhygromyxa salina]
MADAQQLAQDAAKLLRFGLQPKLRPANEADYGVLLRRYDAELELRGFVHMIADGLGLVVLGVTELGLVLGAEPDGPFALTLADYRRSGLSVEARMCHGLIQLLIAAYCFPSAASLEDATHIAGTRVCVNRLVEHLVNLAREFERRANEDPELGTKELREAWRAVLSMAQTRGTTDGRSAANTLSGMTLHALKQLERGGLMRKLGDQDGGSFQALGAYRLQVRELAALPAFRLVRDARAREERG